MPQPRIGKQPHHTDKELLVSGKLAEKGIGNKTLDWSRVSPSDYDTENRTTGVKLQELFWENAIVALGSYACLILPSGCAPWIAPDHDRCTEPMSWRSRRYRKVGSNKGCWPGMENELKLDECGKEGRAKFTPGALSGLSSLCGPAPSKGACSPASPGSRRPGLTLFS